jgi:hypothetical protein
MDGMVDPINACNQYVGISHGYLLHVAVLEFVKLCDTDFYIRHRF